MSATTEPREDAPPMERVIFDLGMHCGDDTAYYLHLGYSVVAVEANPALCDQAQRRFGDAIGEGRLTIINAAVTDAPGDVAFYLSSGNDQWSSTDRNWAGRNASTTTAIRVPGISLSRLLREFGTPHYIKIDIEGADLLALEQLERSGARPDFISVEDCRFGFEYVERLRASGYTRFQLSDQSTIAGRADETGFRFSASNSGPFGEALPAAWLGSEAFLAHYTALVRDRETRLKHARHGDTVWWDIHARR
jgi:FkbM family methyltransferase